ncbi:MAG: TonB-dependent receptor [Methylophilus sp.]|uniref:TonB-dependent receptor n=1 Tax=Methylophilus sp. TaxID=29541 RepID=UPI003FA023A7
MFKQKVLSVAILAALSGMASAAEDLLDEVVVKGRAEPKAAINLNKPNSTASRLGLTAKETPASVEAVDSDTIRQRGDISIKEAVTRTTGITDISTPGNGQSFSSRGFTGNNSVAQAEDGVRLVTGAGTLTYPSDTWGYERIEVLRGPASVIFGDGSAGGVINSVRKKATSETSLEALFGWGTRGNYRTGVGGSGAIGEVGAFRIDASALGGNGYIDRGDYKSKKIMSSFLFTPTENLSIGFTLDHAEESPTAIYGSPLVNGNISRALRKANFNVDNDKMDFVDTRARAKVEWDISPSLKFKNETYWFKSDREWRNAENYALNTTTNRVTRSSFLAIEHEQTQYGNRMELASMDTLLGHQNRIAAGWEISHTDFLHSSNAGNTASDSVPVYNFSPGLFRSTTAVLKNYDADLKQQAFFVEDAFNATDKLKLIVGLRKDLIDTYRKDYRGAANVDQDFSPLTWRAGAVFDLTPETALYGQMSRGTDPVTNLLGLNLANAQFDLTKSRQHEVGIKHLLPDAKGQMTLALYHIAKDDIITRDPITPSLSIQGGKQSSRGIEFATTLFPIEHWRTDFNIAILDARFDELKEGNAGISRAGNTPSNVPERVANAWLYYQQPKWEAGVGARYVGKRYADNANAITMDSYTVYDASAAWNINRQITVRANLRNLTDKFYAALAYGNTQQIIGAPRQLELTAEFKY